MNFLLTLVALAWASVGDASLHVSPSGSDVTGNGLAATPWATPQHAADQIAARNLLRGYTSDLVVWLEPGTYPPMALGTAHSGTSSSVRVFYRCHGAPLSCVISGGTAVDTTTCATWSGSVQRCVVPSSSNFYTLYENGNRATLARASNVVVNPIWPDAQAPYFIATSGGSNSHTVLGYSSGDVDLSSVIATDVSIIGMSMGFSFASEWWYEQDGVTSVDATNHLVTLAHPMRYYTYDGSGSRYMFQGDRSWIDTAGEWYMDRSDAHGAPGGGGHYLYVWPTTTPIANDGLVYPTTQDTVSINGTDSSTNIAHDVAFDGIWFRYSDSGPWFRFANAWGQNPPAPPWPPGTSTGSDWDNTQGQPHAVTPYATVETVPQMRHGLVSFTNATRITFTNSRFSNSGFACVYAYLGSSYVSMSNVWVDRCGYDGIEWEGGYPREGDQTNHHTVANAYINRVGELYGGGSGIDVLMSSHNTVSNVTIKRSRRSCLLMFSDCELDPTTCYVQGNAFDHVAMDTCMEDTSDGGGFYTSAIPQTNNTLNQIDIKRSSFEEPSLRFAAPAPFYTDAESGDANGQPGQTFTNIDIAGSYRDNSGGESFTYGNVSWNGSGSPCTSGQTWITGGTTCAFTATLMDYANIGFNRSTFPFTAQVDAENSFSENFENGISAWTAVGAGTPHLSTTQAHSATHSFVVDADKVVIGKVLPSGLGQRYAVWFYDDTTTTNAENCARADRIDLSTGSSGVWDTTASRGLCASKSHSSGFYSTWINNSFATTTVARSTGWHYFSWDYTDGVHAIMRIDGIVVAAPTGLRAFDVVSMGDYAADGLTGVAYFDDPGAW